METEKDLIKRTLFFDKCSNCGHSRDWHHQGDLLATQLFGVKLGECTHYDKDETLPFWKRKKKYCDCKKFVLDKKTNEEVRE